MIEIYDLHSHSTASDGMLTPTELVQRAHAQGVTALALTDHDTTLGLEEAQVCAKACGIRLISGIELSSTWQKQCFHIVGLDIDQASPALAEATLHLQTTRQQRAEKIAEKLAKKRIPGAWEAVSKAAGEGMVTRTHFADFLLSQGHVSTQQEAFDRYLGKNKSAYVATAWADMELAVSWIKQAGGIAVLAHPLRYQLSSKFIKRFLTAFKQAGGQGIEVITGRCNPDEIRQAALYATGFELMGSVGSDFHSPTTPWVELGRLAPLPGHIKPVWEVFTN